MERGRAQGTRPALPPKDVGATPRDLGSARLARSAFEGPRAGGAPENSSHLRMRPPEPQLEKKPLQLSGSQSPLPPIVKRHHNPHLARKPGEFGRPGGSRVSPKTLQC